jgi:hypothetical protein
MITYSFVSGYVCIGYLQNFITIIKFWGTAAKQFHFAVSTFCFYFCLIRLALPDVSKILFKSHEASHE